MTRRFLSYNFMCGNYKIPVLHSLSRLFLLLLVCCCSLSSFSDDSKSYVVDADIVEYDNKQSILIAKGNVEITTDEYIVKSNKIVYYKKTSRAYAYGNVRVIYPNQDIIKSDFVELNHAAKEVVAHVANAIIDKDNKFNAEKVYYHHGGVAVFEKVSYTSCPVCEGKKPQWQISSSRVVYEKEKDTSYWNNIFKIYGMPVFYLPYLRSASPDAPPKSGFMIPNKYKSNGEYGHSITVPYYLRISDNKDLLYSPMITSKKGILHQAEFRHLLEKGEYSLGGNYIKTGKSSALEVPGNRYHAKGDLKYSFNDKWRVDAKLDRVSDKAYLHNYWEESPNYLNSNIGLSYVNGYDYGSIEAYSFQGLRSTDSRGTDILILPLMNYHKTFNKGYGNYTFDYNAVNILRDSGVRSNRVSGDFSWDKTYYFYYQELKLKPNLKLDIYNFLNKNQTDSANNAAEKRNQVIRALPSLEVTWKYPFVSRQNNGEFYLEPVVDMIASPNSSENEHIINEDSQEVEISDSNLFSRNRYAGFDRVETGTRINYGILSSGAFSNDVGYTAMVGQSYRANKDSSYAQDSGMHDRKFSDYVGRIAFEFSKDFDAYLRGRIDSKTNDLRRGEVGTNIGFSIGRGAIDRIYLGAKHIRYNYASQVDNNKVEKSTSLSSRVDFSKEWYIGGEVTRNGTKNSNFLVGSKIDFGYKGECSDLKFSLFKDYTKDLTRGVKPTKGFSLDLEVHLKNIN